MRVHNSDKLNIKYQYLILHYNLHDSGSGYCFSVCDDYDYGCLFANITH